MSELDTTLPGEAYEGFVPEVSPTAWALTDAEGGPLRIVPEPLVRGTILCGKYEVLEVIGTGGASVVYRGRSLFLDREVALKVQTVAALENRALGVRFLREMRLIAAVEHPAVIHVYEVGALPNGALAAALELVQAPTLHRVLRDGGKLTPELAVSLALQLFAALGAVHGLGIVHRDVKPTNLLLMSHKGEPALRLIDFGVARDVSASSPSLTRPTDVLGTPGYMAPEQAMAGGTVDARADLFSAGTVLFEMLTGERLFRDTAAVLATLAIRGPGALGTLRGSISPELFALLSSLVAADASARPQSADAARALLLRTPEADRAGGDRLALRPREVLVVADSPMRRDLLARMVRAAGCRPTVLAAIGAAQWILESGEPRSATVLIDAIGEGAPERHELAELLRLPEPILAAVLVVAPKHTKLDQPRARLLAMPLTEHDLGAALR